MINDTAAYNLAQNPRKGTEPPSKPNTCSTPTSALHWEKTLPEFEKKGEG